MKKGNIITLMPSNTKPEVLDLSPDTIAEELRIAIEDLIQRMRLGSAGIACEESHLSD